MLEAVIGRMNFKGRIIFCGGISGYNDPVPQPGPNNMMLLVQREITLRGFVVMSYFHLLPEFYRDMGGWLKDGKITYRETTVQGIENAADAFMGMMQGQNIGKMLVQLAPDPTG